MNLSEFCVDVFRASGYIYDNHVNSTSSPIVMYRSSTIELYSTSLYSDSMWERKSFELPSLFEPLFIEIPFN